MRREIPYSKLYLSSKMELSCSSFDTLKIWYNNNMNSSAWDPSRKMRHEIPYSEMYFSSQMELSCSSYDNLKV